MKKRSKKKTKKNKIKKVVKFSYVQHAAKRKRKLQEANMLAFNSLFSPTRIAGGQVQERTRHVGGQVRNGNGRQLLQQCNQEWYSTGSVVCRSGCENAVASILILVLCILVTKNGYTELNRILPQYSCLPFPLPMLPMQPHKPHLRPGMATQ